MMLSMGNLITILLTLILLVCNVAYCGRRIVVDLRASKRDRAVHGLLALCGALLALVFMSWATFTSLGRF